MVNIIVLYFGCYGHSLHIDRPNPFPSTFYTWQTVQKQPAHKLSKKI